MVPSEVTTYSLPLLEDMLLEAVPLPAVEVLGMVFTLKGRTAISSNADTKI